MSSEQRVVSREAFIGRYGGIVKREANRDVVVATLSVCSMRRCAVCRWWAVGVVSSGGGEAASELPFKLIKRVRQSA